MNPSIKYFVIVFTALSFSCKKPAEISSINPENWLNRAVSLDSSDSVDVGKSYLSIYSQIHSINETQTINLTSMVSMRNISDRDTIYLLRADYFDSHGKLIRTYFDYPVYLAPLETTEIVIDYSDETGGTGSNFIFEWQVPLNCPEPLIESVMTSSQGHRGSSFTTHAIRIQ